MMVLTGLHPATAGALFQRIIRMGGDGGRLHATTGRKNILNSLKLRLSYGETGLDESAGRFQYMTTYSYNPYAYVVNGKYTPGFTEGNLASPDLTWYTTRQMDFGFDFASLNNRLYGSFDYFYYSTKGYLVAPRGDSYLNTALGVGLPG